MALVVGASVSVGESLASSSSSSAQSSSSYTLPRALGFLNSREAALEPVLDVGLDPDLDPGRLTMLCLEFGRESLLTMMAGGLLMTGGGAGSTLSSSSL